MDELSWIVLSGNKIRNVQPGAFRGMAKVHHLSLSYNNFTELTSGMFDGLDILKELFLSGNEICNVQPGTFRNLTQVENLKLDGNNLTALRKGLFDGMEKLRELDMQNNQISSVDSNVFKGLINLYEVFFQNNFLTEFVPGLFNDSTILREVHLSFNDFVSLPVNAFNGLSTIRILTLHGNKLISLPAHLFQDLQHLTNVTHSDNRLQRLSSMTFKNSPGLSYIYLNGNLLQYLPSGLFTGLNNLLEVDLNGNWLTSLPENLFQNLLNLQTVKLSDNRLNSLASKIFENSSGLSFLDLAANNLQTIDQLWLPETTINLGLGKNPLECNRSLSWILNGIWQGTIQKSSSASVICIAPDELAGREFFELQQGDIFGYVANSSQCKMPFVIPNSAHVTPDTDSYPGRVFSVTCLPGYYPSEASGVMECGGNNEWINQPTCNAFICDGELEIDNSMSVLLDENVKTGSNFTLICQDGFSPSTDSDTVLCGDNTIWLNKPTCNANLCTPRPNVNNSASVTFFPPSELQTGTGFVVFCDPGHLPKTTYGMMICDENGAWVNSPTCLQEEITTSQETVQTINAVTTPDHTSDIVTITTKEAIKTTDTPTNVRDTSNIVTFTSTKGIETSNTQTTVHDVSDIVTVTTKEAIETSDTPTALHDTSGTDIGLTTEAIRTLPTQRPLTSDDGYLKTTITTTMEAITTPHVKSNTETTTSTFIKTTVGIKPDFSSCTRNPCNPGVCRREGMHYFCECPTNYLATKVYPRRCVMCSLGEHYFRGQCRKCPQNTYSHTGNLAHCLRCPKFYSNGMTGSTSVHDCKLTVPCKPGYYITHSGQCKMCHDGTYQTHGYHSNCVDCGQEASYTTGGPGATYHDLCTLNETMELDPFKIKLGLPYLSSYADSTSSSYLELTHRIVNTLDNAMNGVRFFRGFRVEKLSEGSVVADMVVTLVKHPYAEDFFKAGFMALDLASLFPWTVTSYYNEPFPEFSISSITPRKGPKAGGTTVMLKGNYLDLHDSIEVYIGETECKLHTLNNTVATCLTSPLEDDALLNTHQKIKIVWPYAQDKKPIVSDFTFMYRPDPLIHSIQPGATLISGGILITVLGTNVDSVSEPVMEVTAVSPNGRNQYFQPCKIMNTTHFVCLAPDLRNKATKHSTNYDSMIFQKTECSLTLQIKDKFEDDEELDFVEENIPDMDVSVDFIMDNVTKLNMKQGHGRFPLNVYANPVVDVDVHRVDNYVAVWPCTHDRIAITGRNLVMIDALWPGSYSIKIGHEECKDIEIRENEITCLPPKEKPIDTINDNPRVRISVACQTVINVYDLRYGENPFDCPVMLIGIGVGLGILAFIFIASIICYACGKQCRQRRNKSVTDEPSSPTETPQGYQRDSNIPRKIKWRYPRMPRQRDPPRQERGYFIDENHYYRKKSSYDTPHTSSRQAPNTSSQQAMNGTGVQPGHHRSRKTRRQEESQFDANQYLFDSAQGSSTNDQKREKHWNWEKKMTTFSEPFQIRASGSSFNGHRSEPNRKTRSKRLSEFISEAGIKIYGRFNVSRNQMAQQELYKGLYN